ncbi:MAG: conjugal transfer protein TraX [Clostridia bacterium]|nr:conjugal transfer protein TraX [Clostridia bacterium]
MYFDTLKSKVFVSSFVLKCIAIISMTIDHIGVLLIPPDSSVPFRSIGRLAFPIFCFLITEGYQYTKNIQKYLIRLLIFALLSEIIVDKIFFSSYFYIQSQNIFFTLFIGLLTMIGMDYCQYFSDKIKEKIISNSPIGKFFNLTLEFILRVIVLIIAILTTLIIKPEFSLLGLAMILAFYLFKNKPVLIIVSTILINILYFEWVQLFACLALVPILLYNGKEGRKLKYFFYTYYPIHLILIFLISFVIVGAFL